jgi:AraC-like DNA-binding protein
LVHFKRKLAIATTTLAAAAFAGGAYAATQDSPDHQRQAFLNDVANRLHVTPQELSAAVEAAFGDQLSAAVKAGRLTQAEADTLAQRAKQRGFLPLWLGGPGLREQSPGGRQAFAPTSHGHGPVMTAAAGYLGLSATALDDQRRAGKTLAQIARSRGKSTEGLKQAMLAPIKSRLDRAVAGKRITSAQEQHILSMLSSRISDRIDDPSPSPASAPKSSPPPAA